MNEDFTGNGSMPPPARRPYKRIPPPQWELKKDLIRTLFIVQDMSIADLTEIMRDEHDFDTGEKQFKRKVDEWGFTKNIPNREMMKMVRKRKKREEGEESKETVFKRSRNGTDFEVVSAIKLDRFQNRNRIVEIDAASESSGMPSNILYGTPSIVQQERSTIGNNDTVVSGSQISRDDVEKLGRAKIEVKEILEKALSKPRYRTRHEAVIRHGRIGALFAFQELYDDARRGFEFESAQVVACKGRRYWSAVALEHVATMMEAASHPGCPQTISLRLTQVLAQRLMILQQDYLSLPAYEQVPADLERTVTGLLTASQSWTEVIMCQKTLQIWVPILGEHHPELSTIRRRLEAHRNSPSCSIEDSLLRIDTNLAHAMIPIQQILSPQSVSSSEELLQLVPLLEISTGDIDSELKAKILLLSSGRSHAFIGGYYSFLGHFQKAEEAFLESEKSLETETCVEIMLHRMLWHSEHYTRVKNWPKVSLLLYEAHKVFMAQETASTFVLSHFPDRFRLLCKAVSACAPIDEVVHEVATYERENPGHRQMSIQPETSQAPSPVREVQRLFPMSSTDHSTIDIDAWRQYVTFSP